MFYDLGAALGNYLLGLLEQMTNKHIRDNVHSEPGRAYNPSNDERDFIRSLQEPELPPLYIEPFAPKQRQEISRDEDLRGRIALRLN